MSISYKKARDIIEDNDILYKIIRIDVGFSRETCARIQNDRHMSTHSLERLAKYLSKVTSKKLQPSDLFEFIY